MSSKIPRGFQVPAETKKTGHKLEPRDTATAMATANAAHKSDAILKPQKENVQRKNVAPKVHKGVSTRYGQQAELKGQNQHLMATNEELQRNLTESQQRVAELELQYREIEKENAEVQKNLKDCHILLVAANIDPVLGERVGEATRQNEDQRKEVMSVSADLLNELNQFGDTASQQRAQLEEIQTTMTEMANTRERVMQERENFSLEAAEMERALKEAEALLS
ncbi:small kinetochore-associated protein [Centropristis striata]|uniref:small kinetochore-associated protein n=1 Tax=Centropristis striata TaxID=184440 RepID=UPI0027E16E0C|nr:small kinetochore-associated protein [Centropristis striata]XP_059212454.1 small kinetochore-associated protein [Centropristis striata]